MSSSTRCFVNPKKVKKAVAAESAPKEPAEIPALGSRRTRKAWREANEKVNSLSSLHEWISALYDWMTTPQYSVVKYTKFSSKTGEPVEFSWVPDKSSTSKSFTYYGGSSGSKLDKKIVEKLDEMLKELETAKLPVLYTTPYKDSVDTSKIRRVIVYRDYIQTDSSRNNSPSYSYALVFAPIEEEYEVLSGS